MGWTIKKTVGVRLHLKTARTALVWAFKWTAAPAEGKLLRNETQDWTRRPLNDFCYDLRVLYTTLLTTENLITWMRVKEERSRRKQRNDDDTSDAARGPQQSPTLSGVSEENGRRSNVVNHFASCCPDRQESMVTVKKQIQIFKECFFLSKRIDRHVHHNYSKVQYVRVLGWCGSLHPSHWSFGPGQDRPLASWLASK